MKKIMRNANHDLYYWVELQLQKREINLIS